MRSSLGDCDYVRSIVYSLCSIRAKRNLAWFQRSKLRQAVVFMLSCLFACNFHMRFLRSAVGFGEKISTLHISHKEKKKKRAGNTWAQRYQSGTRKPGGVTRKCQRVGRWYMYPSRVVCAYGVPSLCPSRNEQTKVDKNSMAQTGLRIIHPLTRRQTPFVSRKCKPV